LFDGQKLLVADDSPYYRTVIGLTFTDEGMEVTTAGDSQEALEKLELSIPDVILANISMPGIGGYELCQLIKQSERFGHIPVMLLAGLHESVDPAEARRVGADDVVSKPFKSIRGLVNRVGSLLGGKAADPEETAHEYSTLGLAGSDVVQPVTSDIHAMSDTNATGSVEAPSMIEPEPVAPTVEGSLPEDKVADPEETAREYSTQGLAGPDAVQPVTSDIHTMSDTDVRVFVEAPSMTEPETVASADEAAGSTCVADVEMQTADTQKLERIDDEPAGETIEPIAYAQDDTIEIERAPAVEEELDFPADAEPDEHLSTTGVHEMREGSIPQTPPPQNPEVFSEGLLDLGDFDSPKPRSVGEDLILDLDYEEALSRSVVTAPETVSEPVAVVEAPAPVESVAPEPVHEEVAEVSEWTVVSEAAVVEPTPVSGVEEPALTEPNLGLSAEAIDAIARRAVELMSEKVVREIAWEVVPELAGLLIKKKLEEQK